MSSRTRQGRSHLNQKMKRQGGLSVTEFTDWLNIKGAMMNRRWVYAGGRKRKKIDFFDSFWRRRGKSRH